MQNPESTVTAGGPVPCLPPELISDILSRIPSKILCRFKCVSKYFLVLISSDSEFKDLHRNWCLKNTRRLLQYDLCIPDDGVRFTSKYKLSQTTFDFTGRQLCDKFEFEISKSPKLGFLQVACCQELVCVYTDRQIQVLNPSTHEFITLGSVENEIWPNSVGIGYVDSSKEYKVVRINRTRERLLYQDQSCQVYTLKDGSQDYTVSTKVFEGTPHDSFYDNCLPELLPFCVDGVLYWMSVATDFRANNTMLVCYLNLKDHDYSYGKYLFPEGDKVGRDERGATMAKLVQLQGYLCVQCISSPDSKGFLIYALKDTNLGVWELLYDISYPLEIVIRLFSLRITTVPELECIETLDYRPAISPVVPHVLGFLPLNRNNIGPPGYVVSQYLGDEISRDYIVDNGGTVIASVDVRLCPRKTRRLLDCGDGLFSFKKLITELG